MPILFLANSCVSQSAPSLPGAIIVYCAFMVSPLSRTIPLTCSHSTIRLWAVTLLRIVILSSRKSCICFRTSRLLSVPRCLTGECTSFNSAKAASLSISLKTSMSVPNTSSVAPCSKYMLSAYLISCSTFSLDI